MSALYRQAGCHLCGQLCPRLVDCRRCARRICAGCMRHGACGACLHEAITLVLKNLPEPAVDVPSPTRPEPAWRWPLRAAVLFASGLLMLSTLFSICIDHRPSSRAPHGLHGEVAEALAPVTRVREPRTLADPTLADGACVCSGARGW